MPRLKRVVLIGSMCCQHRHLMEAARRQYSAEPGARCIAPYDEITPADLIPCPAARHAAEPPNRLVNEERGHWHCVVDRADVVVVVRKADGTLGAGTVDELMHAMGIGKTIEWS